MVKKEFPGGGRPFARIFACNLSLRDIVFQVPLSHNACNFLKISIASPQFYCDVLHRQAQTQYPQSRDLASKMDKMYQTWWEYLHVFVEQPHTAPFIDGDVLRDIATRCVSVRPRLQVQNPVPAVRQSAFFFIFSRSSMCIYDAPTAFHHPPQSRAHLPL
jgi:hypothetical protein